MNSKFAVIQVGQILGNVTHHTTEHVLLDHLEKVH